MAVVVVAMVAAPAVVSGNPGEPRVVRGTVAWVAAGDSPFIVVTGDDGRHYVADLAGAQWRGDRVAPGDRVSVAGVEGARPWHMSALVAGSGDSALAALSAAPGSPSASSAASPSASPATTAPARPPDASAPVPRSWRRIEGTVDSLTDTTLRLREAGGRTVAVDVSRLTGRAGGTLRLGDRATVFVVAEGDQRLVAVGFVSAEPAASPR
jgi:hypothetical protein